MSFDTRLERRRFPQIERFGRLHIIMTVNQKMRARLPVGRWPRGFRDDDGIAFGWAESRFQSDALAMLHDPLGAGLQILLVRGLGGNAGETKILAKFINGAGFVLFEI